jgi:hypothetical protein
MSEVSESGRAWTITWLLAVFMLINFLDKIVLGLVAVPMMDELGLTPKQFGDIGSGFFWLFAIGGVLGGFLANHLKAGALITGMVLIWSSLNCRSAIPHRSGSSSFAAPCWRGDDLETPPRTGRENLPRRRLHRAGFGLWPVRSRAGLCQRPLRSGAAKDCLGEVTFATSEFENRPTIDQRRDRTPQGIVPIPCAGNAPRIWF